MTTEAPAVAEALANVMGVVQSISKDQAVTSGPARFNFRGVDDVMQAVGPALRSHGVIFAPSRVVSVEHERYETAKGSPMDGVTVVVEYTITGPRGDTMTAAAAGQAADSGDKAVPKAMSVAFRTVLLQALCIPTGDRDPDADPHERAAAAPPDPRQDGWNAISAKARHLGVTVEQVRAAYQDRTGHAIDGPESTVDSLRDFYADMGKPTGPAPATADQGQAAFIDGGADPWTTPAPVGAP